MPDLITIHRTPGESEARRPRGRPPPSSPFSILRPTSSAWP